MNDVNLSTLALTELEGVKLEELEPIQTIDDESIFLVGTNKTCRIISLRTLRKAFAGNPEEDKENSYYNVTYIDNIVNSIGDDITNIKNDFTTLDNKVTQSIQNIDQRFSVLESTLSNKITSQINDAIKTVNDRVTEVERSVNSKVSTLETNVDNKMKDVDKKIKDLKDDIEQKLGNLDITTPGDISAQINAAIRPVNEKVSNLETSLDSLETRTDNKFTTVNNKFNDYTLKSEKSTSSIPASSWTGGDGKTTPYRATISVSGATRTNNIEVLLPSTATYEQVEAWCAAAIVNGSQDNGAITLNAYGDKPEISIPIELIVRKDI